MFTSGRTPSICWKDSKLFLLSSSLTFNNRSEFLNSSYDRVMGRYEIGSSKKTTVWLNETMMQVKLFHQ